MQEEENKPIEEPTESPAPAEVTDEEVSDSLDRLLEEAEHRGYLRARNEIARAAMKKPRLWENRRRSQAEAQEEEPEETPGVDDALASDFLTRIRPSVWD